MARRAALGFRRLLMSVCSRHAPRSVPALTRPGNCLWPFTGQVLHTEGTCNCDTWRQRPLCSGRGYANVWAFTLDMGERSREGESNVCVWEREYKRKRQDSLFQSHLLSHSGVVLHVDTLGGPLMANKFVIPWKGLVLTAVSMNDEDLHTAIGRKNVAVVVVFYKYIFSKGIRTFKRKNY